jgi:hypothetical protein
MSIGKQSVQSGVTQARDAVEEGIPNATSATGVATAQAQRAIQKRAKLFSKPLGRLGPRQAMWPTMCWLVGVTPSKLQVVKWTSGRSWR